MRTIEQSTNLDYTVTQTPASGMDSKAILRLLDDVNTPDNVKLATLRIMAAQQGNSEWLLNQRTDTGEYLGVVSKDYVILQNSDLRDAVESALARRTDLGAFERNVVVLGAGEKVTIQYSFPSFVMTSKKLGDVVRFGFETRNSFDRSWLSSILGLAHKLACLNGMTMVAKELELLQRHSRNLSLTFINAMIDRCIDLFKGQIGNWENMAEVSLTQIEGRRVIAYTAQKLTSVSTMTAKAVAAIWENPTYDQDGPRNLFSLYSAFTQHLRDESSYMKTDRVQRAVASLFHRAMQKSKVLAEIKAPRETEFLLA